MATVLGIVLLGLWVVYLFEGRNEMNRREHLSSAFVFQWNVLPLIFALELFVTGKAFVLIVGLILFAVAWPFARYLVAILPFMAGFHLGIAWFSEFARMEAFQVYAAAIFCAIGLTLLCQFVYVAMLSPPRSRFGGFVNGR